MRARGDGTARCYWYRRAILSMSLRGLRCPNKEPQTGVSGAEFNLSLLMRTGTKSE